jgi:aryl-phospho-beta-D-glucosidase BglC (GH1 family)
MIFKILVVLISVAVSLFSATPVELNGHLKLSGANLVNEAGDPVQLRGMSTHGIQYYEDFYNENSIEALATGWGADIIRISSYVNEGNNSTYLDKPAYWRGEVDKLVDYATKYGMYAMIDWHMLGPGDPNINIDEAKEFWEYMAQTHGAKNNVIFDICNEPNNEGSWNLDTKETDPLGYTVTWDVIKEYADAIIPIIRTNDPNNADYPNIIIVGTPDWASSPNQVIGNEVSDANTMYSMHFYANDGDADPDATYEGSYIDKFMESIYADLPLFVTEFGTQDPDGDGDNNWSTSQAWLDTLAKYNISWCNWNYSDDKRSGAVFKKGYSGEDGPLYTIESYSDSSNLKFAGQWIMSRIKFPGGDHGPDPVVDPGTEPEPEIDPTPDGTNLIENGDFSDGITGWDYSIGGDGDLFEEEGVLVFEIYDGANDPWDMKLFQTGKLIENGKTYKVTFMAKAEYSRAMMSTVYNEDIGIDYPESPVWFDLATDFQEFEYTFIMNEATDPSAIITFDLGGVDGDIWIDDITLSELVPTGICNSYKAEQDLNSGIFVVPAIVESSSKSSQFFVSDDISGRAEITVFDALGNLINSQTVGIENGGNYSWDLKNRHDRVVSSGSYRVFMKVTSNDGRTMTYSTIMGIRE